MLNRISRMLDHLSEFLAWRKGLLPTIGLFFILVNLFLQFVLPGAFITSANLFLHLGLVIAILGLMLAWAL